ncbi:MULTISPECIES: hypothetical protein [Paraburkholderia]|uniref:Uncharacterized protein n=1 Tax=Paraburkholderia madseniana TaxID=2599607 RepID=A0AAP5BLX7_9BURK|nr:MULTISPECIES: hypothetical protein [Paraburkholderia]MCX4151001.1 hypothetical protein [Paraburkholderia madseniana]MCX4176641.1 hypothetical protein [Paraburkholderia madseniana]MDN7153933.1 hypothetical protein [Paraburkholderia sp. WS6]MDQ6412815.1 hypothetical protein [Paraburkholderia madseniana]MDQ6464632.1 hypothetical protein [Paraburkholderia madseniana]
MPILCSVIREQIHSEDTSGRPYTMELVHYTNATTGQLVRTKCYILPSNTVHVVEDVANLTEAPERGVTTLAEIGEWAAESLRAVTRLFF